MINKKRVAERPVCYDHLVSNKGELNNCVINFFDQLDDVDISVWSKPGDGLKWRENLSCIVLVLSWIKHAWKANETGRVLFEILFSQSPRKLSKFFKIVTSNKRFTGFTGSRVALLKSNEPGAYLFTWLSASMYKLMYKAWFYRRHKHKHKHKHNGR